MADIPKLKMPGGDRKPSGLQACLKARHDDFTRAGIILMLTPIDEEYEMNLIELQKMSSAELRDTYNRLAERQIKRFADRVEAEKRTAQQLVDAKEWSGPLPGKKASGKAGAAPASKGKSKAAPSVPKAGKAAAKSAPKATKKPGTPRENLHMGRPSANRIYRATDGKDVTYKVRETSQRGQLFAFIKAAGAKGVNYEACEQKFLDDEDMNVRAHLGILLKVKLIEAVK